MTALYNGLTSGMKRVDVAVDENDPRATTRVVVPVGCRIEPDSRVSHLLVYTKRSFTRLLKEITCSVLGRKDAPPFRLARLVVADPINAHLIRE